MKAMRTTSLKHSTTLLLVGLSFATAASLLPLTGRAQGAWEANEVKVKSKVYRCKKDINLGHIFIYNSTYPENLLSERAQYNPEVQEFSYVKLVSHDAVLNAFRRAFTAEEIGKLAELKEHVSFIVHVGEGGQILTLAFSIRTGTTISPASIETLENELLKGMQFEVIGKRFDYPIFYTSAFRVYFSEVEKGELRMARASENLKAPGEY